jgi:hypothetical protein
MRSSYLKRKWISSMDKLSIEPLAKDYDGKVINGRVVKTRGMTPRSCHVILDATRSRLFESFLAVVHTRKDQGGGVTFRFDPYQIPGTMDAEAAVKQQFLDKMEGLGFKLNSAGQITFDSDDYLLGKIQEIVDAALSVATGLLDEELVSL